MAVTTLLYVIFMQQTFALASKSHEKIMEARFEDDKSKFLLNRGSEVMVDVLLFYCGFLSFGLLSIICFYPFEDFTTGIISVTSVTALITMSHLLIKEIENHHSKLFGEDISEDWENTDPEKYFKEEREKKKQSLV